MRGTRLSGRKLLIASVGVAAVNYACSTMETSGNLVTPPPADAGDVPEDGGTDAFVGSGNLVPPPPDDGGSTLQDANTDDAADAFIGSGNLVPPDTE